MYSELFNDYYRNNNGILFKKFEININNIKLMFDVYWGDPDIIFDKSAFVPYPLALIKFPKWKHEPNTRIYLHEKVDTKYATAFEFILAHEIGHFCLFDFFGINHPGGYSFLNEHCTEVWADFFAYKYFVKHRNINNFKQLEKILIEVDDLQNIIYSIPNNVYDKYSFTNKINDLKLLGEKIQIACDNSEKNILLMLDTFEEVLTQIGEIIR